MKRARHQEGSVVKDKRRGAWMYLWRDENGHRHTEVLGRESELPTKAAAHNAAEPFRRKMMDQRGKTVTVQGVTVRTLVESYRKERMPARIDTRRSYDVWLQHYILPQFGDGPMVDVKAWPVELWLNALKLAPKSKTHIRGLLRILWKYAMLRGDVPTQENPMGLVSIKGATKRVRKPRSLSAEEFRQFAGHLEEPFRTIAVLCVSLGLRISEALALKWSDIDWLGDGLRLDRAIVCQNVDDVKTAESGKPIPIAAELLALLKVWHVDTQFSASEDWVFASPVQLGRLPWSYDQIWRVYQKAATAAGIGALGTHSLRHTFRSWLAAVGASAEVQRRLMRHTDPAMALKYGEIVTGEMEEAQHEVAMLALKGLQNGLRLP